MEQHTTVTLGGDLTVGRIGYGAMRLTGEGLWGEYPDREHAIKLLREAVEAGVSLIDTADAYGPHTNEVLIREALHPYPEHVVIATKGGFVRGGPDLSAMEHDPSVIGAIGHPAYLKQSARLSARRLGVERIDLYYLHSGYATDVPFEDQVATLAQLREEGIIRHIGLSNVTPEQLRSARSIVEIAAVTGHFNVASRGEATLLEETVAGGSVFAPWQPVSLIPPGVATDTNGPEAVRQILAPIAEAHRVSVPQIALAWLLARSPEIVPIPATTSPEHLRDNLGAYDVTLTARELAAIDAVSPES
ncbi:aldo/keto reductase [Streptomyces sp. DW26H14]|uniref:aldo/keto reductase n=1 Tax=Streptomyces sp. DW26H14 TaxID=3435395 RepID=UPI00403E1F98